MPLGVCLFWGCSGEKTILPAVLPSAPLPLYLQFWVHDILVDKGDWSAIEDTSNGILFGATVLVAVTMLLNVIAALRRK